MLNLFRKFAQAVIKTHGLDKEVRVSADVQQPRRMQVFTLPDRTQEEFEKCFEDLWR